MFENNRRNITVSMMKSYPQLLRKFISDKGKVAPLVEVISHMNLELYSLKRQEQVDSPTYLDVSIYYFELATFSLNWRINFYPEF